MRQWATNKSKQIRASVIVCLTLITLKDSVCNMTPEGVQPAIDITAQWHLSLYYSCN